MTDLRQAAQAVVERWDTPAWEWRDQGPTADLMADLRKALAQPEQEPSQWRDMVVVSLVREGINKHRARELADHFATPPALPMKAADEFELHRLLAEERYTVRQLSRALREQVESPTFMGEPLITPPAAQPEQQAEPCIGKDPRCPCQDGDACHYKDCGDTKAWPVPEQQAKPIGFINSPGPITQYIIPTQRPWVGLTDEDRRKFAAAQYGREDLLIAAEAKLKERNT